MKQIQLYVLKLFISPLITTFFVIIFVLLMQFLWLYIDDIVGKGLETMVVLEFFYLAILRLIPLGLPLTILLASLMTFGNMGEKLELLSMKAAGISLFKIMQPMVILVVFISILAFFFSDNVLPMATRKWVTLFQDINRKKPEMKIKEGVFNMDSENLAIRVNAKDEESGMLYGVHIYDHSTNEGNTNVTVADSGMITSSLSGDAIVLTLHSGVYYTRVKDKGRYDKIRAPFRRDTFRMQELRIQFENNLQRSNDDMYSSLYFSKNLVKLKSSSDSLKKEYNKGVRRFQNVTDKKKYRINFLLSKDNGFTFDTDTTQSLDTDSLLLSMSKSTQENVMRTAITFATNLKKDLEIRKRAVESEQNKIRRHELEMHKKFTLSLGCLIFLFIGAPLGAIIRKGGFGMPVVLSIVFFLIYYIFDTFGQKFAKEGVMPVWQGIWISSIIYIPLGIFLTYQAITDSVIMNTDAYTAWFKKVFGKRKKQKGE